MNRASAQSGVKKLRRQARKARMLQPIGGVIGKRPFATINPFIPDEVRVGRKYLWWRQDHYREATTVEGMLDAFIAVEMPQDIEEFSTRFGVLHLCALHGLPMTHAPGFPMPPEDCEPERARGWMREPIDAWYGYASRARGILEMAAKLRSDRPPTVDDWCLATGRAPVVPENYPEGVRAWIRRWPREDMSLDESRAQLCNVVDEWTDFCGVRPRLWWPERDSAFIAFNPTPAGVLALQLASAVTGYNRIALCSACVTLYQPSRKPQAGRRNYCQECGDGVASKYRHRRLSDRRRSTTQRTSPEAA